MEDQGRYVGRATRKIKKEERKRTLFKSYCISYLVFMSYSLASVGVPYLYAYRICFI